MIAVTIHSDFKAQEGREVVGGFRMGSTCTSMADSSQCMAKPIQCCKVKLINYLIKKQINEQSPRRGNLSLLSCFPLLFAMRWWGQIAMILVFLILSFKLVFSLSSFTLIKKLFSSSSPSAIRVVSSAYLRLLIFLLAILIPACISSSPAFRMMCSEYKLNKQGDNIQTCRTLSQFWTSQLFHIRS